MNIPAMLLIAGATLIVGLLSGVAGAVAYMHRHFATNDQLNRDNAAKGREIDHLVRRVDRLLERLRGSHHDAD